jgi:hypothetical protein
VLFLQEDVDQDILVSSIYSFDLLPHNNTIVYFFLVGGCARHLQNPATKYDLAIGYSVPLNRFSFNGIYIYILSTTSISVLFFHKCGSL